MLFIQSVSPGACLPGLDGHIIHSSNRLVASGCFGQDAMDRATGTQGTPDANTCGGWQCKAGDAPSPLY